MTRIALGLAANALLVLLVGHAFLYGIGLARLRPSDLRLLGLSYLAGRALLGSVLSLTLLVGIDPRVPTAVAVSLGLVAACAVAGRPRRPITT